MGGETVSDMRAGGMEPCTSFKLVFYPAQVVRNGIFPAQALGGPKSARRSLGEGQPPFLCFAQPCLNLGQLTSNGRQTVTVSGGS